MALIIVLKNISNLADISDYEATVMVGDGTHARSTVLHRGHVRGHRRADGWQQLVQQFIAHAPLHGDDITTHAGEQ